MLLRDQYTFVKTVDQDYLSQIQPAFKTLSFICCVQRKKKDKRTMFLSLLSTYYVLGTLHNLPLLVFTATLPGRPLTLQR